MSIDIRKILCPIDFSRHAELVVEWAIHLAEEHDSKVLLLHAYHLPVEFQQLEGAYLPADFWDSVKQEAERSLASYAQRFREKDVPVTEIVREGYPANVIQDEARQENADMIVMGSRGLSALKHMLLGSIAERVVQKAHCPVLTVSHPADEES